MSRSSIPTSISFPDSKSHPNVSRQSSSKTKVLVFFITGNPGLINYYHTFLSHLYSLLSTSEQSVSTDYEVYGRSLRGFEVDRNDAEVNGPFGLEEQIESVREDVMRKADVLRRERNQKGLKVILMGHSVGAYILLEVVRRLKGTDYAAHIVGGVCLFPTVTWIAKSQSGRKFSSLLAPSHSALIASLLARLLTFFIPFSILATLIRYVLSFPPEAAHTTAAFIKSQAGVRQALHMARDEMTAITHDSWTDEIWGSATKTPETKLVFLFGTNDHWVADEARDELILARGRRDDSESWKPLMEVDVREGWQHGFCISHGSAVAKRAAEYLNHVFK